MRFLVVGLGSMGRRRVRCLRELGYEDISAIDLRVDRAEAAAADYGVNISDCCDPDAMIISVPPDLHWEYMRKAMERGVPSFVEASVTDGGMEEVISSGFAKRGGVCVPSATMLFHPEVIKVREMLARGDVGKVSNVMYHSGSWLPDWHKGELGSDYYVSRRETGGAREIVPFELTWITSVFGFPERVCGNFRKTVDIPGAEGIDDTYNILLDYRDFLMTVTVDVASRVSERRLVISGDKGQTVFDLSAVEGMYLEETKAFIGAVEGGEPFPNTMVKDHRVLKLLYAIEESDRAGVYVRCPDA